MKRAITASKTGWLLLAALLAVAASAGAAPSLKSTVEAPSLVVGDGFNWAITVQGAHAVATPDLPEFPDFFVHADTPQIHEQDQQRTHVFRYRLIPRRAGLLMLPAVAVRADGESLTTEPSALNVSEVQNTPDMRVEISFERKEVFVGEPVAVTITWLSALPLNRIKALDLRLPLLYHPDFSVIVPEAERHLAHLPNTIGLPVEGQRVIGLLNAVQINDRAFSSVTFRRILVPKQAGDYAYAPARLLCSYLTESPAGRGGRSQYPSFFDNDFFQEAAMDEGYVRYRARSEVVTLRVRPLPAAGRPADFSGLVGKGQLLVQTDPQVLTIGDPVTLTAKLRGFPHPEAISLPPLGKLANFSGQFLVPAEESTPRVDQGDAVFIQSVKPLRTAVTQLPPLTVTLFNPETEKYQTLTSAAIPLRIRPEGDITAIDLGSRASSELTENPVGIWHNLPAHSVDPLTRGGRLARRSAFVWLLLLPLVFHWCKPAARNFRLKRTDPERWRQTTAFGRLRRALKHAVSTQAQRAAVSTYLSVRLGIREGALSFREISQTLKQRGIQPTEPLLALLRELFHHADLAYFGRAPAVAPLNPARLAESLGELERKLNS